MRAPVAAFSLLFSHSTAPFFVKSGDEVLTSLDRALARVVVSDYAAAPELDHYDPTLLARDDDEELHESYEKRIRDRLAAEEELDALDAKRKEREMEADYNLERVNRFDMHDADDLEEMEQEEMDIGADRALNLEKFECSLKAWISEERTRREIFRRFRQFLRTYYDGIERNMEWQKQHENENGGPMPPLPFPVRQPIYLARIR